MFCKLDSQVLFGSICTIVNILILGWSYLGKIILPWQVRHNLCQHSKNRDAYLSGMWLNVDLRTNIKKTLSWGHTRRKLVHYNRPLRLGHCDSAIATRPLRLMLGKCIKNINKEIFMHFPSMSRNGQVATAGCNGQAFF
jgi:hypothetical protein